MHVSEKVYLFYNFKVESLIKVILHANKLL